MTTRSWPRSTTERKATWNHWGDVAVRKMMWKYEYENEEESSTIIADNNLQSVQRSEWRALAVETRVRCSAEKTQNSQVQSPKTSVAQKKMVTDSELQNVVKHLIEVKRCTLEV